MEVVVRRVTNLDNMDLSKEKFLECVDGCTHTSTSEACTQFCMHNIHLSKWCIRCRDICGVVVVRPNDIQERS